MKKLMIAVLAGSLAGLAACEQKSDPKAGTKSPSLDGIKEAAKGAAEKTGEAAKDAATKTTEAVKDATKDAAAQFTKLKDELLGSGQTKLDEFGKQFEAWKGKAASAAPQVKPAMDQALATLGTQLDSAKTQLASLKGATSESWTKLSEEFKGTLDKLAGAFKNAAATFGG